MTSVRAPGERLARLARDVTDRRTALPREAYERAMTCTGCGTLVAVFEAASGARTAQEHQHVDESRFRCSECMVVV